jgi:hypothetical protein
MEKMDGKVNRRYEDTKKSRAKDGTETERIEVQISGRWCGMRCGTVRPCAGAKRQKPAKPATRCDT